MKDRCTWLCLLLLPVVVVIMACGNGKQRLSQPPVTTAGDRVPRRITAYADAAVTLEQLAETVKELETSAARPLRDSGLTGMSIDRTQRAVTFSFADSTRPEAQNALDLFRTKLHVVCVLDDPPGGAMAFGQVQALQEREDNGERCWPEPAK